MSDQVPPAQVISSRYEILGVIGKGGMSTVYKARDLTLGETVALKVIRPEVGGAPEAVARFRSEIKLARRVRHRNVCAIYEYGEDGALRYIVMEFVEGQDLRRLIRASDPLSPTIALDYSIQTAHGLQAIHEAGIVHRDVKTTNITVDASGTIRLMDFGIARLLLADTGSTQAGMIVGTPDFMSPEQARGEVLDQRSDIYSLGVVIYEIFTGRLPFTAETPLAVIFKHLGEDPPLEVPAIPEGVRRVLRRALAKAPGERYPRVQDLLVDLESALVDWRPPSAPTGALAPSLAQPSVAVARSVAPSPRESPPSDPVPVAEVTGFTGLMVTPVRRSGAAPASISRSSLSQPTAGTAKVFLCYRQDDSADIAGRIHDHLCQRLGHDTIFKDVDAIPLGANFRTFLEGMVNSCVVQLVIIGRQWLEIRDANGEPRLHDPSDWVRIEIEAALARDIPIVPLLVQGASMPRAPQLPPSLQELVYLQGAAVRRDPDFHSDISRLVGSLDKLLALRSGPPGGIGTPPSASMRGGETNET